MSNVGMPIRSPILVLPEMTIAEAARLMNSSRVDAVLVGKEGKVLGIVTEKDIVRAVASGLSMTAPVSEIMSRNLVTGYIDEPLPMLAAKMIENDIRHLPVFRDDGSLVGLLSIKDVLRSLMAFGSWP